MVSIIDESPDTVKAHLALEIDPAFGLILHWNRLGVDNVQDVWYSQRKCAIVANIMKLESFS